LLPTGREAGEAATGCGGSRHSHRATEASWKRCSGNNKHIGSGGNNNGNNNNINKQTTHARAHHW
jgi:hypothetical protein